MTNTEMGKYLTEKVMMLDAALEAMANAAQERMAAAMDDEQRGACIAARDEVRGQLIAMYNAAVAEKDAFDRANMPKINSVFFFA